MTAVSMPRRRLIAAALALPLAASACTNILPGQGPPVSLFRLSPKSSFAEDLPRVDWQLVLETPTSASSLTTTRVALQRDPMQVEYYARAGWVDRAPEMLQTLLLESFENADRIVAVGRENIGLRSDFILKTDVREFQAIYFEGTPPKVLVSFNLKLVQMPQRTIIGTIKFEQEAPATADTIEAVISAYDDALGKVLRKTVEWTLVTGQKNWAERH